MKKLLLILLSCLLLPAAAFGGEAEGFYETTVQVREDLPLQTIRITDTGQKTGDFEDDHILLCEVFAQDGSLLQSFPYFANEMPPQGGAAAPVLMKDLNFDGSSDMLLLTASGARNMYYAFLLWDKEENCFRPPHQENRWLRQEARFSDEMRQTELCNPELFPQQNMIMTSEQDGYRFRREICYMWDSAYELEPKYIWDVYDAGEGLIGEAMTEFKTRVTILWDEQYPEEWYYGQEGVAGERMQSAQQIALAGDRLERMRVANVDWVNLRKQDSKTSPSLAKLNAGETVTVLQPACGAENGWVRVVYDMGENQSLSFEELETGKNTLTGYIWHSFLEPLP